MKAPEANGPTTSPRAECGAFMRRQRGHSQAFTAGANTVGQGRQLYQQGLGSILNAQTSVYNTDVDASGQFGGSVIGAAGTVAAAFI